jgi:hypothetical protein
VCAVCAALLFGISEGRAVCAVERGVVVGWLVVPHCPPFASL